MTQNLKLFGQFELSRPEGKGVAASAKLSAVLAFLVAAGKPVRRDQRTSLLWRSHFEEQARQNFRLALVKLRKSLGTEVILADACPRNLYENPEHIEFVRQYNTVFEYMHYLRKGWFTP